MLNRRSLKSEFMKLLINHCNEETNLAYSHPGWELLLCWIPLVFKTANDEYWYLLSTYHCQSLLGYHCPFKLKCTPHNLFILAYSYVGEYCCWKCLVTSHSASCYSSHGLQFFFLCGYRSQNEFSETNACLKGHF